jgi:hypothetical protein
LTNADGDAALKYKEGRDGFAAFFLGFFADWQIGGAGYQKGDDRLTLCTGR